MKYLFSGNVKQTNPCQLFEIYNTKLCLTRLEHYKGPYEKSESYVVCSLYKWMMEKIQTLPVLGLF